MVLSRARVLMERLLCGGASTAVQRRCDAETLGGLPITARTTTRRFKAFAMANGKSLITLDIVAGLIWPVGHDTLNSMG